MALRLDDCHAEDGSPEAPVLRPLSGEATVYAEKQHSSKFLCLVRQNAARTRCLKAGYASALRGVVLDLNPQGLQKLQVLLADLEFGIAG
jgi:hypothetical protein